VCISERKVGRKPVGVTGKMTPAVARDLGIVSAPPLTPAPVRQNDLAPAEIDVQPPTPTCNNHPDRPAKIDRLGRSMSLCVECLSVRGRKAGIRNHERGLTAPPVSIPLNLAKYAPVREWIEAQAKENERTLQAEIMYRLKLAMRGTVG
jgi:hypothetical protein